MKVTIRQARIFLTIHETGSVTGAAKKLNRTQTSITKALQNMEQSIGVAMFDRSARGVDLTPYGTVLLKGANQALDAFRKSTELIPPIKLLRSQVTARFFEMDVSEKWLDAFLAIVAHRNTTAAAESLALSTTAVSSSVRKFENCLDTSLFERTATGLVPTHFATALATNITLARNFLRHSLDEISSMLGSHTGNATVGTLPLVRSEILPRAIIALLKQHPDFDIATTESPYPDLIAGLRSGDIDFLIGALRGLPDDEELVEEVLFHEPLSVVVRTGHPLLKKQILKWQNLQEFKWVLPRHGTPTRELFEQFLTSNDLPIPEHLVETSSFITLRGLLMNSDRLTVLSQHQISVEAEFDMLATLPLTLTGTDRAIGITRRRGGTITPAAELLVEEIRQATN